MSLKKENKYLYTKCEKLEETLKKVRVVLIQERAANIMHGKGGVEMFNDIFEILKEGEGVDI